MKKIKTFLGLAAVLLIYCSNPICAQSVFQHSYGDTLNDEAYCVYLTTDNSYLMAGYSNSFNTNNDVYLIKTNQNGVLTWSKSIDILGDEKAYSIIEDFDTATYYVSTGDTKVQLADNSGTTDVFIMFNDIHGNPYRVNLFGDSTYNQHARCIVKTNDNAYLIVGNTDNICSSCGTKDIYLVKTDLAGNLRWSENIDIHGGQDYGMKLVINGDKYIITGYTWQEGKATDAFLIETDTTGAVNWARTYGDTAKDYSYSVVISDSGYTIAGHTYSYDSNTDPDVFVVKTNLTGVPKWKTKYDCNRNNKLNYARDLIFYNNYYYLTGWADVNKAGLFDLNLLKLNINGLMQWQRAFGKTPNDRGYSIIRHSNRVVMTGFTNSFGRGLNDVYLVKTDLNGVLDCYNTLADTNTTYLDSTYTSPHTHVEKLNEIRSHHFDWVSPISNDSICYYDTIPNDTTHRYENIQIGFTSNEISIYPNPVKSGTAVNIEIANSEEQNLNIEIYDMLGKKVQQSVQSLSRGHNVFKLNVFSLPDGMYVLHINSASLNKVVKICVYK